MSVTEAVKRLVWVKAAGICAFPDCRRSLVERAEDDPEAQVGEVAHIVGRSVERGPRSSLQIPGGERNGAGNLLLLCPTCHTVVDKQPHTYTVERLLGIKEAHERWVADRLQREARSTTRAAVREELYSTFMPVDRMPRYVYTAPCALDEKDVRARLRWPADRGVIVPFLVREKKVIAFWPLTEPNGPFVDVISEAGAAERHLSSDWWADPDLSNWYVTLLNRALNKLTGRRGLRLDREHHRYYFEPELGDDSAPDARRRHDAITVAASVAVVATVPEAAGEPAAAPPQVNGAGGDGREEGTPAPRARARSVSYRPLNKAQSTKSVVWQPVRRSTGAARNYWIHLALGLRFHRVSPDQWVLSIRPERRFTMDGFEVMSPKGTGRRATSMKSHMYNAQLLAELQFWRDYLADGLPNIILNFGAQHLVLDAQYATTSVEWPGVRGDAIAYGNAVREHDLFTAAAYDDALRGTGEDGPEDPGHDREGLHDDAELDVWEEDEMDVLLQEDADDSIPTPADDDDRTREST